MSQSQTIKASSCSNQITNGSYLGHWWGLSKASTIRWTDIYGNLAYTGNYDEKIPGMDQFTIFNGGEDCFSSWHGYNSQQKGADHPCNAPDIGYICIAPWADPLEAPKIKHDGSGVAYDDVYKKCAEKGLYPLIAQNLMDVKKV